MLFQKIRPRKFVLLFVLSMAVSMVNGQDILNDQASLGTPVKVQDIGTIPMPLNKAVSIEKNKLLYAYQDASNPTQGQVRIITVNNGVLSQAMPTPFATTLEPKNGSDQSADMLALSPKHFFVAWQQTGTPYGMGALGTINGDTITMSPPVQVTPHKGEFIALAPLSHSTFVCLANDASRRRGTARFMTITPQGDVEMGEVVDFVIGKGEMPGYIWNTVAAPLEGQRFVAAWRSPLNNQGVVAQMGRVEEGSILFAPPLTITQSKTYPRLESLGEGRALLLNNNAAQGQSLTVHALSNEGMKLVQTASATACPTKTDYPSLATRADGSFCIVFRDRDAKSVGSLVTGKVSADGKRIELGRKQTLNSKHTVPLHIVALDDGQIVLFYMEPGVPEFKAAAIRFQ